MNGLRLRRRSASRRPASPPFPTPASPTDNRRRDPPAWSGSPQASTSSPRRLGPSAIHGRRFRKNRVRLGRIALGRSHPRRITSLPGGAWITPADMVRSGSRTKKYSFVNLHGWRQTVSMSTHQPPFSSRSLYRNTSEKPANRPAAVAEHPLRRQHLARVLEDRASREILELVVGVQVELVAVGAERGDDQTLHHRQRPQPDRLHHGGGRWMIDLESPSKLNRPLNLVRRRKLIISVGRTEAAAPEGQGDRPRRPGGADRIAPLSAVWSAGRPGEGRESGTEDRRVTPRRGAARRRGAAEWREGRADRRRDAPLRRRARDRRRHVRARLARGGVSRGLLHYYFGTKERLLIEVLRSDAETRIAMLDEPLAAAETVDEVIAVLVVRGRGGAPRATPAST